MNEETGGVMPMNDLVVGILLGLMGLGVLGGLVFTAFFLGTRQSKSRMQKANPPPEPALQKRRVPTGGTTIPKGGIAQTQFSVSSLSKDSTDKD